MHVLFAMCPPYLAVDLLPNQSKHSIKIWKGIWKTFAREIFLQQTSVSNLNFDHTFETNMKSCIKSAPNAHM